MNIFVKNRSSQQLMLAQSSSRADSLLLQLLQQQNPDAVKLANAVLNNPKELLSLSMAWRTALYNTLAEERLEKGGVSKEVRLVKQIAGYVMTRPNITVGELEYEISALQAARSGATWISDTSSSEKRQEFLTHFPGIISGSVLPFMSRSPEPELEGSAQGNADAKSQHAGKLSEIPPWLQMADVMAAKGIIPHDVAVDLAIWYSSHGTTRLKNYHDPSRAIVDKFSNEQAIWDYLRSAALSLGQGVAYDRIVNSPTYVVTDDSQTEMWLKTTNGKRKLTFGLLAKVIKEVESNPRMAKKYKDLLVFRDGIVAVAAYLEAARSYKKVEDGQPWSHSYVSPEQAWKNYIEIYGGSGLLGVDGAPIASLLGPDKVLLGLNALAEYLGVSICDIHVDSQSNVNATRIFAPPTWNGPPVVSSQGVATYRFQSWEHIQREIARGKVGIHLSHTLLVDPVASGAKPKTVIEHIRTMDPNFSVTSRAKALQALRQKMAAAGVEMPAPDAVREHFRPLGQGDTIRIVIPDQTGDLKKKELKLQVFNAWKNANSNNNPRIEFVSLQEASENPEVAWQLLGSTAVFLVDPSLAGVKINAPDTLRYVRLAMNLEIDGTVGHPQHGQTPTFLIGDVKNPETAVSLARESMDSLYIHGRAPNPIESLFCSLSELPQTVSNYWKKATVRPADSDLPRMASPRAEPISDSDEVVFALYGSAKEYVDPKYPAQMRLIMSAAVEAHAQTTTSGEIMREPFMVAGSDLVALGRQLGVVPYPSSASATLLRDYGNRFEAAVKMMPGVVVTEIKRGEKGEPLEVRLLVPVMRKRVVFSHGGGVSPHDARRPDDPTMNIMGAFNGLYLARQESEKTANLVKNANRGVTTLSLQQKEGRDTLPLTSELIYADHILQRTLQTQRGAHVAFSTYGGIGTEQEKLYFPGVLVLVEGANFSNDRVTALRNGVGLKTILLNPEDPNYEAQYRLILKSAPSLNLNSAQFERRFAELTSQISELESTASNTYAADAERTASIQNQGGQIIRPDDVIGTQEQRHQRETELGANSLIARQPDVGHQRFLRELHTQPNPNVHRIELPTHTGHGRTRTPPLPNTTAHQPEAGQFTPITVFKSPPSSDKDRFNADPLPRTQSNPDPLLTQAISQLRSGEVSTWQQVRAGQSAKLSPLLRVLLTQAGLQEVLRYGLGMKLLESLSQNGHSRYLGAYKTAQVLQTISLRYQELAPAALALRERVLKVAAARRHALTSAQNITPAQSFSRSKAQPSLQQSIRQIQRSLQQLLQAATPARRIELFKSFQPQLIRLVGQLNATRHQTGSDLNLLQRQALDVASEKLQQALAWGSDPQRQQDLARMNQTAIGILTALTSALLLLPQELFKSMLSEARV